MCIVHSLIMNKVALNEWTIRDCLAQHTDKWREFTKPGYEGVSTSLGLMQTQIHCSDKDLWTIILVYPNYPCPPKAGLQHRATSTTHYWPRFLSQLDGVLFWLKKN